MLTANCGYDDAPQGPKLLMYYGPTIVVNIGFDQSYNPKGNRAPKAAVSGVEALVDTGAQESCIDEVLAADLGLPVTDRRTIAGVGSMEVDVHLVQIHIPKLKFTEYGAFAAVPLISSGFRFRAVIGRTLLRHMTMSYDGTTGRVYVSRPD